MAKLICPHCNKPLAWKLLHGKPLPGERKILPHKAVLVCPFCNGELHNNPHPAQLWVILAFSPLFILLQFQHASLWVPFLMLVTLLLGIGVSLYVHLKFLRNWPRFSTKPVPIRFTFIKKD
jgi:uncharacterized protein YbaR (Trm112 family)